MNNITAAFKDLRKQGLFARQNFSCCQSCAGYEAATIVTKSIDKNPNKKNTIMGCVYYHGQDADDRDEGKDFYLAYGPLHTRKHGVIGKSDVEVGKMVVAILNKHGVETEWDGSGDTRILVKTKSIREFIDPREDGMSY